jgi:hypothetical protein
LIVPQPNAAAVSIAFDRQGFADALDVDPMMTL